MKYLPHHLYIAGLVEYFLHHHYKEDDEKLLSYHTQTDSGTHFVTFNWVINMRANGECVTDDCSITFTDFDQFENDCRLLFEGVMKLEIEREAVQDEKYNHERGIGYA